MTRPPRTRALCLLLAGSITATAFTATSCAPIRPQDRATYDSLRIQGGMTQYEVQGKLGKPWDAEETAFGTVWTYRYKAGMYPLLRTFFIFPLIVTMPFFFTTGRYWKSFKKRYLRLTFDDRARVDRNELLDRWDDPVQMDHLIPIALSTDDGHDEASVMMPVGAAPREAPGAASPQRGPSSAQRGPMSATPR